MNNEPKQTNTVELDLKTDEITRQLAEAPVFAKKGIVRMRKAVPGETVATIMEDGRIETSNAAGENDVIITNPGGEEYIISADKAAKRYEPTEEEGVYRATGMCRAFKNPTGSEIQIMAPWGEPQYGGPDCMIATTFNPDKPDEIDAEDRYIIDGKAFIDTYGTLEEVYGESAN